MPDNTKKDEGVQCVSFGRAWVRYIPHEPRSGSPSTPSSSTSLSQLEWSLFCSNSFN